MIALLIDLLWCDVMLVDGVWPAAGPARQISVSSGEQLDSSCKQSGTCCTCRVNLFSHFNSLNGRRVNCLHLAIQV